MTPIKLDSIDSNSLYTADDVAELFGIHRTSVHKKVFPRVTTTRIGRHTRVTGEQLIRYARGETQGGDRAA